MVIVGLVVLGAIINAFDGDSGGGATSSDNSDALTERTCEIARDISQDAADGVDTTFETRDRFKIYSTAMENRLPPTSLSRCATSSRHSPASTTLRSARLLVGWTRPVRLGASRPSVASR
jgi:hypothetical protein